MRPWLLALLVGWASCQCREPDEPVDEIGPKLAAALAAKGPSYRPRTRHLRPDGRPKYTNRLILEASPYLLEHAHNPVDWYPWGDEAFAKAAREDRPILLSIGYASCHWCHVMADESWEDEAIARQINRDYVAIKVDREERPDVDAIYLAAVERLTGDGGWPLTVILLPDRRPIFGGTYFAPHDGPRGPGLATVLARVRRAYDAQRGELAARADRLVAELGRAGPQPGALPGASVLRAAVAAYAAAFDPAWGGFGGAPKFPRPAVLDLLLRYHRRTGDAAALAMATRTLDRMAAGGIHDHVGGGFHRYAVDAQWRIPHFEKMLYDNAQLAAVYLAAYQVTHRAEYAAVARDTLDFLIRELQAPDGGFYAALDADAGGGEGRTYTWTAAELDRALGPAAGATVREVFDVTVGGSFEDGRSVLWRPATLDDVAARLGRPAAEIAATVDAAIPTLRAARATRPRPRTDDKRIVGWNGLAISALARGALVLDDRGYLDAARSAAAFVLGRARTADGRLAHQVAGGRASGAAFLDDVAFLEAGLLELLEADPDPRWLQEAFALQQALDARFADPRGGYFFTAADQDAVLVRDKPASDDALPAGNSIAALAALRLAELTGEPVPRARAEATLRAFAGTLTRSPTQLPAMLAALDFALDRAKQIVVVTPAGDDDAALLAPLRAAYVPNRVVLRVADHGPTITPLLAGKTAQGGKPTAYVCLGTQCERPTSDPAVLAAQLARAEPL